MIKLPKIGKVLQKKFGGNPALFYNGKVVHIGSFSTEKQYKNVLSNLMKKYPRAKEEDFGMTFIPGPYPFIG